MASPMPHVFRLIVRDRLGRVIEIHRIATSEPEVRRRTLLNFSAVLSVVEETPAEAKKLLGFIRAAKDATHA